MTEIEQLIQKTEEYLRHVVAERDEFYENVRLPDGDIEHECDRIKHSQLNWRAHRLGQLLNQTKALNENKPSALELDAAQKEAAASHAGKQSKASQ